MFDHLHVVGVCGVVTIEPSNFFRLRKTMHSLNLSEQPRVRPPLPLLDVKEIRRGEEKGERESKSGEIGVGMETDRVKSNRSQCGGADGRVGGSLQLLSRLLSLVYKRTMLPSPLAPRLRTQLLLLPPSRTSSRSPNHGRRSSRYRRRHWLKRAKECLGRCSLRTSSPFPYTHLLHVLTIIYPV